MKGLMKWPLIIAAILVVLRVTSEQMGAPEAVNKIFGVTWLFFLVPFYFAFKIAATNDAHPYKTLFLKMAIFAALVRAMIIPTYWLAYRFNWSAQRFSAEEGGVVGDAISPLSGYLLIPLSALIAWVIAGTLIGGGLGSLVIAWKRRGVTETPV
ncbi:hypothetical protein HUU05_21420 [candidate division KSB1 bacterium]|nr:hypothetical protein [candidate division KSB1 bacterium]